VQSFPALALIESNSIARGVVIADALVKKAHVTILQTHPVSPGKHVTVFAGEVAEVEEALAAGTAAAAATLVDRLFLPYAHAQLAPLVAGERRPPPGGGHDSVAIVETFTLAATIAAADAAAKAAEVTLLEMRLGQGIGGKAYFTMTGALDAVEAAAAAGRAAVEAGLLAAVELIPAPHADLRTRLFW
jgi:microcompartment protein CcmL/EutN